MANKEVRGELTDDQIIDLSMGRQSGEYHERISDFILEKWLTSRENRIIQLRFVEDASLQDVADEFGVTRERIRQLESKALRKLRFRLRRIAKME